MHTIPMSVTRTVSFMLVALLVLLPTGIAPAQTFTTGETSTIPSDILDPYSVSWLSVRNMTSEQYGQFFVEKSREGYMVIDIEVDDFDGEQRVGAVWQRNLDGRGWYAIRDLNATQFEDTNNQMRDTGYRLIDLEVYLLDGFQHFAGVWIQNLEDLDWISAHDLTSEQFSDLFSRYSDEGYMLIDLDAYMLTAGLRYLMVWVENSEGLKWQAWRNMTSEGFSAKFQELRDEYRMIDFESYSLGEVQLYAGIWVENVDHRFWVVWRDMSAKSFGDKWLELRDAGYRLINYEIYETADGWRYAGVWRQNGIRPEWQFKDEVNSLLEDYAQENSVPGMSVVIYHGGNYVFKRGLGFADVEGEVIAQSRTIYRTASIAKGIAGVLGVLLSEKGLIDLEAPVQDYIAGIPNYHTYNVEQTITNRSGLGHYPHYPSIGGQFDTAYEAVQELWDVHPAWSEPGIAYLYSTHAYTFLGAAMEGAVGGSIGDIFQTHMWSPYNLNSMLPEDRDVPHKFRASLYNTDNLEVTADNLSWKTLGGGFETSTYDLVRFATLLLNNTILDEDATDLLWTPPDNLRQYAFGWDTGFHYSRVIAKSGAQNGARSHIRIYPDEDLVIAVMSNRRGHDVSNLSIDIADIILGSNSNASLGLLNPLPLSLNPFQEEEVVEPEDEAQHPDEVIWPVENPVATPSPEDLWEDDDEPVIDYTIFMPLLHR
jgi:CubicO group peptidase (beta-lactamase class C family)